MLYALANGVGKTRASRSGLARPTARWRTVALSSGELKTASAMALAGQLIHAGQEVRMLNVPVTNQQHGAWDNLHGHASGSSFTIALKAAAAQNYGHPARRYIEQMTHDNDMTDDGIAELLDGIKATIGASLPPDCDGQITRALEQFALVAMAGELATNYGITGWPEGDATAAASWAFTEWLKARTAGTANAEDQQAEDAIRAFIDRHGSSRFGSSKTPTAMTGHEMPEKIVNQCGWWRDQQDKDGITHREWLFSPTGMKEALHGLDFTRAIEVLVQRGFIAPDKDGKRQVKAWIQGRSIRVYVVCVPSEG